MRALHWDRLTEIKNTQMPYRGTTNRYPIADRKHNTKCFYVEERGDETVYVVTYGYRYQEVFRTEEEYKKDQNNKKQNIFLRDWEKDETKKYVSYIHFPRELGIIRSDNTFEFTSEYYGQGDNILMSRWSRGWFFRSSRYGGMVYKEGMNDIFHPIFEGMRVNLDTMMPHESSIYKVTGKRVNRKDAKQFLSKYADFYKINEVMFKTIDWKTLMDTAVDTVKSLANQDELINFYLSKETKDNMIAWADKNINVAPLDSALAFAVAHDIGNMYRRVRSSTLDNGYTSVYGNAEIDPMYIYSSIKRKLNKELYKRHDEVMKPVEYTMGKRFPQSEWGLTITVDGKEVEQY